MFPRATLVLLLAGCSTKEGPAATGGLAALGVQSIGVAFDPPEVGNGANVRATVTWNAGTPCVAAPDVVASLAGVAMTPDQAGLGGTDPSGACITTGSFQLDRGDLAAAPGLEDLVLSDATATITLTLDRPFTPRHLIPGASVHTLGRDRDVAFGTINGDTVLLGGTATLVSRANPTVSCPTTVSGPGATLHIPATTAPGRYRLSLLATADLVNTCPVAHCSATRDAMFSQLVDIQ